MSKCSSKGFEIFTLLHNRVNFLAYYVNFQRASERALHILQILTLENGNILQSTNLAAKGSRQKKPLAIDGIREKPMGGTHLTNNSCDTFFDFMLFRAHFFFLKKVDIGQRVSPPPRCFEIPTFFRLP